MKTLISRVTLAAIIVLGLTGAAWAHDGDHDRCTDSTIRGTYGFTVEGFKLGGPPGSPIGPMRGVALTKFNGEGEMTQTDTVVVNGVKTSDFTEGNATGTYHVNSDCTGTFSVAFPAGDPRPPITTNFVVTSDGKEIDAVVIAPPGVLLIAAHGKQR